MQQNIIDTNAKVEQVCVILSDYVQNNGCLNTSMEQLREAFAAIYPPSAPDFLYHFSTLARTAIAKDIRRGRHPYPIGGTVPENHDPMEGKPFILPGKSIFHDLKNVFCRALGKDWNSNRSDSRNDTVHLDTFSNTNQEKNNEFMDDEDEKIYQSFPPTQSDEPRIDHTRGFFERIDDSTKGKSNLSGPAPLHPQPYFSPENNAYSRHVDFVMAAGQSRGRSNTPSGTPTGSV